MRQHLLSSRNWQKAKQKLSAKFGQFESSDRANSITRTITPDAMMMKLKGTSQESIVILWGIFLKIFSEIFAEILLEGSGCTGLVPNGVPNPPYCPTDTNTL